MGYRGDRARLRVALNELITGRNFTLSTIGGSVTVGHGSAEQPSLQSSAAKEKELRRAWFQQYSLSPMNGAGHQIA